MSSKIYNAGYYIFSILIIIILFFQKMLGFSQISDLGETIPLLDTSTVKEHPLVGDF